MAEQPVELDTAQLEHIAMRAADRGDHELERMAHTALRLTAAVEHAGDAVDDVLDHLDAGVRALAERRRALLDVIRNDPDLVEWMERGRNIGGCRNDAAR